MPEAKQKPVEIGGERVIKLDIFSEPHTRFLADGKKSAAHQALVDNPAFDVGTTTALAQYAYDLASEATDLNTAASVGFRLRGAVNFLTRFKTLGERPREKTQIRNTGGLIPTEPPRRP